MSKIIIFGATGNTGLCSLRHAIETGKIVKAFVRDEKKIPDDLKGKCQTYVGDVKNADQVAEAISGVERVIVVLGTRNDLSKKVYFSFAEIVFIYINKIIIIFSYRTNNSFI